MVGLPAGKNVITFYLDADKIGNFNLSAPLSIADLDDLFGLQALPDVGDYVEVERRIALGSIKATRSPRGYNISSAPSPDATVFNGKPTLAAALEHVGLGIVREFDIHCGRTETVARYIYRDRIDGEGARLEPVD